MDDDDAAVLAEDAAREIAEEIGAELRAKAEILSRSVAEGLADTRAEAQRTAREIAASTATATATDLTPPVAEKAATETADRLVSERLPGYVVEWLAAHPPKPGKPGAKGDTVVGPAGLRWRGPFRSGVLYLTDDAVEIDGSSYIATSATQAKPPGPGWDLLAKKGDPGSPGGGGPRYIPRGGGTSGSGSLAILDEGVAQGPAASLDVVGSGGSIAVLGTVATLTLTGGATPDLDDVLAQGNDAGGLGIVNVTDIGGLDVDVTTAGQVVFTNPAGASGGSTTVKGGQADTGGTGGRAELLGGSADGGSGARVQARGASAADHGVLAVRTANASGALGEFLGSDDDGGVTWSTPAAAGAAGGVLAGTYPNPSFAVDMATQAELDVVSAVASAAMTHPKVLARGLGC